MGWLRFLDQAALTDDGDLKGVDERRACLLQSFTLYTYSPSTEPESERWADPGVPDFFFDDIHAVREAVMTLRKDITSDPERDWPPMRIEKLETLPLSKQALLSLLNDGVGAFLKSYEVVEIID